jgi:hypothetical protein
MTRTVREDQHGTNTAYTYGCRCNPCCEAARVYRREYEGDRVSAETVERVYEAIEREADMDGLCTASTYRLAEMVGLSQKTAHHAVHKLAEQKRVQIVGRTDRGILGLQIEDFA